MDDGLIKQQTAQALGGQILGNQLGASREKAQTIVKNMAARHESQLMAWRWLNRAMENMPPSDAEEAALWELISRVRHERY